MLGAIGTPAFTGYSSALYRRPDFFYPRQQLTMFDAAGFFLKTTDALLGGEQIAPSEANIPAVDFATVVCLATGMPVQPNYAIRQSSPGMIRRMNSSKSGTVNAVSPWLGL